MHQWIKFLRQHKIVEIISVFVDKQNHTKKSLVGSKQSSSSEWMFLWEWFWFFGDFFRREKMISHVRTNLRSVSECIEDILMLLLSTSSLFSIIIMLIVIISDCWNARVILNCKNNRKTTTNRAQNLHSIEHENGSYANLLHSLSLEMISKFTTIFRWWVNKKWIFEYLAIRNLCAN